MCAQKKTTISFRLDLETQKELLFVRKNLNLDISKTIKEAIHSKYLELKNHNYQKTPGKILDELGFIGAFEGSSQLSSQYKERNLKTLKKKHGS